MEASVDFAHYPASVFTSSSLTQDKTWVCCASDTTACWPFSHWCHYTSWFWGETFMRQLVSLHWNHCQTGMEIWRNETQKVWICRLSVSLSLGKKKRRRKGGLAFRGCGLIPMPGYSGTLVTDSTVLGHPPNKLSHTHTHTEIHLFLNALIVCTPTPTPRMCYFS